MCFLLLLLYLSVIYQKDILLEYSRLSFSYIRNYALTWCAFFMWCWHSECRFDYKQTLISAALCVLIEEICVPFLKYIWGLCFRLMCLIFSNHCVLKMLLICTLKPLLESRIYWSIAYLSLAPFLLNFF